jgi:hypothetical protein
MILLVTSSRTGAQIAAQLEEVMKETITVVDTVRRAITMVRENDFTALVLDEPMVEIEPENTDALLQHSGMSVPVYVKLSVSCAQRVAREVRFALRRYQEARMIAVRSAESLLRSEIRDAVTGILLSTELALHVPEMPTEAAQKLRSICVLASQIRDRLESVH